MSPGPVFGIRIVDICTHPHAQTRHMYFHIHPSIHIHTRVRVDIHTSTCTLIGVLKARVQKLKKMNHFYKKVNLMLTKKQREREDPERYEKLIEGRREDKTELRRLALENKALIREQRRLERQFEVVESVAPSSHAFSSSSSSSSSSPSTSTYSYGGKRTSPQKFSSDLRVHSHTNGKARRESGPQTHGRLHLTTHGDGNGDDSGGGHGADSLLPSSALSPAAEAASEAACLLSKHTLKGQYVVGIIKVTGASGKYACLPAVYMHVGVRVRIMGL